jgi:hypothetical protein
MAKQQVFFGRHETHDLGYWFRPIIAAPRPPRRIEKFEPRGVVGLVDSLQLVGGNFQLLFINKRLSVEITAMQ